MVRAIPTRVFVLLGLLVSGSTMVALACPFCTSLPKTLSDDLDEATAAVIVRYESVTDDADGVQHCRLRISNVVKGEPSLENRVVEVVSTRELSETSIYWLLGFGNGKIEWAPPAKISADGVSYLQGLNGLAESGPRRLEYFLNYLQHPDEFVAADAYNEFAEASLEDISGIKSKLDRQWVISQIRNISAPLHRRRLCWTFLSQCGIKEDADLFDEMMRCRKRDASFEPGLDAAIACFVSLGGEEALARIDREILANATSDESDCFAAVSAIRVHGTELDIIPRERLAMSLRLVLGRPALADLVISDLARWEDWSAIGRMVELFELSSEETRLLRPAVVLYLKNCPLPEAQSALAKLRKIDRDAVQSAEASMMFHSGIASVPVPPPDTTESEKASTSPDVAKEREDDRIFVAESEEDSLLR